MKKIVAVACLVTLLIAVCLVGMTLAFCMADDPRLFQAVTGAAADSVSNAVDSVGDGLKNASSALKDGAQNAAWSLRTLFDRATVLEAAPNAQVQVLTAPDQLPEPVQAQPEPIPAAPSAQVPSVTALISSEDGREVLTGGVELFYYNQNDPEWADQIYGDYPIGLYGCGPTAMAMAVSSLTDTLADPAGMAGWCARQGYSAGRSGSYVTIVAGTAEKYGLACRSLDAGDPAALLTALAEGGVAVALMGPGHFSSGGDYMLLHGATPDGQVLVADPQSRENSLVPWDVELILDELAARHASGAPLWLLTPGDAAPEPSGPSD